MNEKINDLDEKLAKQGFSKCNNGEPLTLEELDVYLNDQRSWLTDEGF